MIHEEAMTDESFDFGDLDARRHPGAEERVMAAVMGRVGTGKHITPPVSSASWRDRSVSGIVTLARPVLAAASLIFVAAAVTVARTRHERAPSSVAESLGVPPVVSEWMVGRSPGVGELWSVARRSR